MPKRDHYLPAAFIGGFGELRPGKRRRQAMVIGRTKYPDAVSQPQKAETFGYDTGLYAVQQPTAALPADYAETWWKTYEADLPDAIRALDEGSWAPRDWQTVLRHMRAVWARHPDFERDVAEQRAKTGAASETGDALEYIRKTVLEETGAQLAEARFALLRRHRSAVRFVTNDKGFTSLHGYDQKPAGVFFPLSSSIAVMMALGAGRPGDDYRSGPYAERTVNAKGVGTFNTSLWNHVGIRSVLGHPDDRDYIAALRDIALPIKVKIRLGPYHGNREVFMDWSR